jgi:uncharacterized protein YbaP (TraB family)
LKLSCFINGCRAVVWPVSERSSRRAVGRPIGWILCLISSIVNSPEMAQESRISVPRNPVWRVETAGNTVYLLGSVHLLKKENYPLPEALEKAFSDSRKLVLEVNLDSLEAPSTQQMILAKGLNPEGKSLSQILSPETYQLARKQIEAMGLNLERFEVVKPWLLSLTLTTLAMQRLGFEPQYGIDKHFFDKAGTEHKEILSLETAEYQLDRFDGMSVKMQETFLLQTLREIDTLGKEFEEIVSAWRAGDTKILESTLLESFTEFPEAYQLLVSERNSNWLPQIEAFLKQKENYLVVVGAGHLIGKDGLISLLRSKGYSVTQL